MCCRLLVIQADAEKTAKAGSLTTEAQGNGR